MHSGTLLLEMENFFGPELVNSGFFPALSPKFVVIFSERGKEYFRSLTGSRVMYNGITPGTVVPGDDPGSGLGP